MRKKSRDQENGGKHEWIAQQIFQRDPLWNEPQRHQQHRHVEQKSAMVGDQQARECFRLPMPETVIIIQYREIHMESVRENDRITGNRIVECAHQDHGRQKSQDRFVDLLPTIEQKLQHPSSWNDQQRRLAQECTTGPKTGNEIFPIDHGSCGEQDEKASEQVIIKTAGVHEKERSEEWESGQRPGIRETCSSTIAPEDGADQREWNASTDEAAEAQQTRCQCSEFAFMHEPRSHFDPMERKNKERGQRCFFAEVFSIDQCLVTGHLMDRRYLQRSMVHQAGHCCRAGHRVIVGTIIEVPAAQEEDREKEEDVGLAQGHGSDTDRIDQGFSASRLKSSL